MKVRRLAGMATLEAANRFRDAGLPSHHRRCTVPPAQAADRHPPRPAPRERDRRLGLQTTRRLRTDVTIAHQGRRYQIRDTLWAPPVLVEVRMDGTMRITHQGRPRGFHVITARPVQASAVTPVHPPRRSVTPRPDPPWRRRLRPERSTQATVANT